jgi:predicted amidohydrolase
MIRHLVLCPFLLIASTAITTAYPRPARLALVQLAGTPTQDWRQYLIQGLNAIDEAGQLQVDMIILPEGVNYGPGVDLTYAEAAIGLDSPEIVEVSKKAKRYNCYIVFPFIQKERGKIYNSAAVFGRRGELVGIYHKTHEPRAVIETQKVTVGSEWPVFDLDIGKVGIMICYDTITPEPAQVYSLLGAEMLIFPHLISIKQNGDQFDLRTRARALDGCVFVASCGWARPHDQGEPGPLSGTCVIDYEGRAIAQAAKDAKDILVVTVPFTQPRITKDLGVYGEAEWKKVYFGERRPWLYKVLSEDNKTWRSWAKEENY